jgi:hypothetical protein
MADGESPLALFHTFNQKTPARASLKSSAAALKPDFSLTAGSGVSVTDITTVAVVEVKNKNLDDEARAQV